MAKCKALTGSAVKGLNRRFASAIRLSCHKGSEGMQHLHTRASPCA